MKIESIVRIVAGIMILVSLALGLSVSPVFVSSYFLWLTAFVGVNLFQSGFTGFCPLEMMLNKKGCCQDKTGCCKEKHCCCQDKKCCCHEKNNQAN